MITIIGAGRVGSSTAMRIAEMNICDVLLMDIVDGLPHGEALDISQACKHEYSLNGSNDFSEMAGSKLVINTAGLARKPGMTRLDLTKKNLEITRSTAENIKKYAPDAIILQVANPVELMSLTQMKVTGFPRERVLGMGGMLDTLRFSYFISKEAGVAPGKVESLVMGEHGDSMVPVASQAKIEGRPASEVLDSERMKSVIERTSQAGAEVIGLKGSTFYAPSHAVAMMAEAIMKDTKAVLPTSAYLSGEYGINGIFSGVPAKLGKNGLEEVVELDLEEHELSAFKKSCEILREKAKDFGL